MVIRNRSFTCLLVSAAIIAVALLMTVFGYGVNLGIDFAGGMSMEYNLGEKADSDVVSAVLDDMRVGAYTVTVQGNNSDEVIIRLKDALQDDIQDLQTEFETQIRKTYPNAVISGNGIGYVGPVAGRTLITKAVLSVLIASVLMLIYIAIRFDLNSGLSAVFGLVHDVLIMLSFMVIFRSLIQMNSSFIAAALTIVGYSINNTIVIFDRIRENVRKMPAADRVEIASTSVRESLGRTICTTATTLITIVLLCVLGVASIREFALPIIIGILSGVYSANLINPYVWAFLEKKRAARKAAKKA